MTVLLDQPAAAAAPGLPALDLPKPYLLFLGDAVDTAFLKTGLGLRDWAPGLCIAEHGCAGAPATLGLPEWRRAKPMRLARARLFFPRRRSAARSATVGSPIWSTHWKRGSILSAARTTGWEIGRAHV